MSRDTRRAWMTAYRIAVVVLLAIIAASTWRSVPRRDRNGAIWTIPTR